MNVEIDMVDVMKTVTVTLKVKRAIQAKIRTWIGVKVITLAAYIMGTRIEIEWGDL